MQGPSMRDVRNGRDLYRVLDKYLGGKSDRPAYRNNTRIHRIWGIDIAVRLHTTDIITVTPDGTIILDWDGWYTLTTNGRMNDYLPQRWTVSGLREPVFCKTGWHGPCYRVSNLGRITIGPRGGICESGERFDTYEDHRKAMNRERRQEHKQQKILDEQYRIKRERDEQVRPFMGMIHEYELARWRESLPVATKDTPIYGHKYLDMVDGVICSRWDRSPWAVGVWRDEQVTAPCRGLNASRSPEQAAQFVNGPVLARIEIAGRYYEAPDKITADSMRIVSYVTN